MIVDDLARAERRAAVHAFIPKTVSNTFPISPEN